MFRSCLCQLGLPAIAGQRAAILPVVPVHACDQSLPIAGICSVGNRAAASLHVRSTGMHLQLPAVAASTWPGLVS